MSRPRRRSPCGRVTPKGTRPAKRRGATPCGCPTAEELLLRDGSDAAARYGDLDEAEVWASSIQPLFRAGGLACGHALSPSRVLAVAEDCDDTAAAAAVAAAIGAYGPPGHRRRAGHLLGRLSEAAAPIPRWVGVLGRVAPRRAVMLADAWGDHPVVWIDFERLDGQLRGVGVELHSAPGGLRQESLYGPQIEQMDLGTEAHPHAFSTEISLADARATVEAGLAMHERGVERNDTGGATADRLRALVDQRIALLPGGGTVRHFETRRQDDVIGQRQEFLAWLPPALKEDAERVAEDICGFAWEWCDGDPFRWSPCRVTLYVVGWTAARAEGDGRWRDAVESMLPRWLRFAGDRRGLDEKRMGLSLKAAEDGFAALRADPADPSTRAPASSVLPAMIVDGVDRHDEDAVRDWVERNRGRFGPEFR